MTLNNDFTIFFLHKLRCAKLQRSMEVIGIPEIRLQGK